MNFVKNVGDLKLMIGPRIAIRKSGTVSVSFHTLSNVESVLCECCVYIDSVVVKYGMLYKDWLLGATVLLLGQTERKLRKLYEYYKHILKEIRPDVAILLYQWTNFIPLFQ